MKLAGRIFRRWLLWVLPVHLLDGCVNRDPYLKIDDRYTLSAICGGCPKSLSYQLPQKEYEKLNEIKDLEIRLNARVESRWYLDEVREFALSDRVLTGLSENRLFLVDRQVAQPQFFPTRQARNQALREVHGIDPDKDLHPPSQWMWLRSRFFFPWVEIYYLLCLFGLSWSELRKARVSTPVTTPTMG